MEGIVMIGPRTCVARVAVLALALALLAGCAKAPEALVRGGVRASGAAVPIVKGAHDAAGQRVAESVQKRYDDNTSSCQGASDPHPAPAALCSGVLIRTTQRGTGYDVWNPNPANLQPNGVSFTWMRKDAATKDLAWVADNGFIMLPAFQASAPGDAYTQLVMLCAFAFDAATDMRDSAAKDGCGPIVWEGLNFPNSGPCQAQGVTTLQAWLSRFQNVIPGDRYYNQCGFTLLPGTVGASEAFALIPQIRAAMPEVAWEEQTEVKIRAWSQNDLHIPLEAFFYLRDTRGLIDARLNQQDFFNKTGRWVPVITVVLPTMLNGAAWFLYVPFDQAIP